MALLIGGGIWLGVVRGQRPQAAPAKQAPPVPVRVAAASLQSIPLTLQAVGQVQALQQVLVRPRIEGVLTDVLFGEGQAVTRGQVLARLDDRELRAQQAQAEAELQRLRSQERLARLDLARYEALAAQSAVSGQQRDQQAAQVAQLQAQVSAQEATLEAVRVQRSHATIVSPISGRAGLRQVDVGNLVRPTDTQGLVTIVQTQPVAVVFAVPQGRLADVRQVLAQRVDAAVSVTDQEGRSGVLAKGRLTTTDNQVDPATGTLRLKAELPNPREALWPGQFVAVTLQTGRMDQALTVPAAALQPGLKGTLVWRVVDGVAEMVPVQVRWQDDDKAVVAGALRAGDRVVIDGQARLKPKARVRVLGPQGR